MDVKFPFDHFLQLKNSRPFSETENEDFFQQLSQQETSGPEKEERPSFTTEIKRPVPLSGARPAIFEIDQGQSDLSHMAAPFYFQGDISEEHEREEQKPQRPQEEKHRDIFQELRQEAQNSALENRTPPAGGQKENANGRRAKFQIDLIPSHEDLMDKVSSSFLNHMDQKHSDFIMDFKKVFENFVVGPSNNLAFAMTVSAAKDPGKHYPCLYIHSSSGLGKTHLLNAVANRIREIHPSLRVYLATAREFMTEMMEAMTGKKMGEFRKKFYEIVDILLIDDIHELKNRPGTQNEFFHIFNELYNRGKQIILTADRDPKTLEGLEERLKTRMTWGLVLDIHSPEYETRIALLRRKIQDDDLYIPDDVTELIARSIKGNMRELEGSLIRLGAYSSVMKVDIDIEIAKEQLKIIEQHQPNKIDLEGISRLVSQYFQIPVVDLRSKVRQRKITQARHLAMYLCYKYLQETLTSIAFFFGKKDHTSTLHAIEKITQQKDTDHEMQQYLNDLEKYF